MNNYYYGKSGKGDFRKEDLPQNRWELFWDTLRTRAGALMRLNFMYVVVWLPTMLVLLVTALNTLSTLSTVLAAKEGTLTETVVSAEGEETAIAYTDEQIAALAQVDLSDYLRSVITSTLLILIPCIAITGPATAGVAYVTRNWARDEHAFIWSDFKDAMKENWKQAIVVSLITGIIPALAYVGWNFYGQYSAASPLMMLPQILVLVAAILWALSVAYFYPLLVTYKLKLKDVLRNGLLLGVARLPMSVGLRLLHCVPAAIALAVMFLWQPFYGALGLFAYYLIFGFALSRFVTASYTNAVFDKYLNSRIEGAKVNQGLRQEEDEEDEEDEVDNGEEQKEEKEEKEEA